MPIEEMSSRHPLKPLNQTAAALMAAAVVEIFPGALIVDGQGTADYFFYDFVFPFEFRSDFLIMIEERMRLILREKREIRLLEMMPANAASLMLHHGQTVAAEILDGVDRAVVEICQIGDFVLYAREPFLGELEVPFFKILEGISTQRAGSTITRIIGAAATQKDILKRIVKQPLPSEKSHLKQVVEKGLFEPLNEEGLWMWCPKGEALRQTLMDFWKVAHSNQNFNFVSTPASLFGRGGEEGLTEAHREYYFRHGVRRITEVALVSNLEFSTADLGLLSPKAYFADRSHLFCPDEKLLEECISSLQFILKIPKILGFEFEIVLAVSGQSTQKLRSKATALFRQALDKLGVAYTLEKADKQEFLACVEIRLSDALGRRWTGPYLGIPETPMPVTKGSMLIRSMFGSLERLVALLLEQKEARLPFFLATEHVRILSITDKMGPFLAQVCKVLRSEGILVNVESGKGPLKTRLYQAMSEKVPYIVLLGEREERANVLTVRANGENKEQSLSLDEFCMRLKSEMRSKTSELTN